MPDLSGGMQNSRNTAGVSSVCAHEGPAVLRVCVIAVGAAVLSSNNTINTQPRTRLQLN